MLGKAVMVLTSFTVDDTCLGFAEIQRRTGLPKATVHRVLGSLVGAALLERRSDGYRLSGLMFELGMRAPYERALLEAATPFLEDLYERTHETVHLGFRQGGEVVYIAKVGGHRQVASPSRVGGRMPLHATALGKALLAHAPAQDRTNILSASLNRVTPRTVTASGLLEDQLARVVAHGVAFEFEESAAGVACVAAPVLDSHRRALAAISVTGPIHRFDPRRHSAPVLSAATGIATALARQSDASR